MPALYRMALLFGVATCFQHSAHAQSRPVIDVLKERAGVLSLRVPSVEWPTREHPSGRGIIDGGRYWVYINNQIVATVVPTSQKEQIGERVLLKPMDFTLVAGDYTVGLIKYTHFVPWDNGGPGFCLDQYQVSINNDQTSIINLLGDWSEKGSCTKKPDFEVLEWAIVGPKDQRVLKSRVEAFNKALIDYSNDPLVRWARDIMKGWPPRTPLIAPPRNVDPLSYHELDAFQVRVLISNLSQTYERGFGRYLDAATADNSTPSNLRSVYQNVALKIATGKEKIHQEIVSFNSIADWLDEAARLEAK